MGLLTAGLLLGPKLAFAQEVTIPDPGLDAAIRDALQKPSGPLTEPDLLTLTNLSAISRNIQSIAGLEAAQNLVSLDLGDNQIASLALPTNLTRLVTLDLSENQFANLVLPGGLTNLTKLRIEVGALTNLTLPAGLMALSELRLGFNQLTQLALPPDLTNLSVLSAYQNLLTNVTLSANWENLSWLDLGGNEFASLEVPAGLTNLVFLNVGQNLLTHFTVPAELANLMSLRLDGNQLTDFALPAGLTNLTGLFLQGNQLTNLTLPPNLNHLAQMDLSSNALARLSVPAGLSSLAFLNLNDNALTNLTLPPDLQQLIGLFVANDPLTSLVLSEPLANTGLASVVDSLQHQGIPVYIYPLTVQLTLPEQQPVGAFRFGITGPPGVYAVYDSTNVNAWVPLNFVNNPLGGILVLDPEVHLSLQKFYRALLQAPPPNMVFLPPGNFLMGSPTNDLDSSSDERPQTSVTLTHGFWIGKYEVTQGEYLSLMNTNPSYFPGDLTRAVSSVSWYDATNYCAQLTARELAAGHIAPGSHYRLPTEAEWEYAARAGSTNRFSYGDDPNYASLPDHAWIFSNAGLMVHPVGQKLPNPSGLYDMEGNVWEWCQDWYGPLPGGNQIDPTGPVTAANGLKVMRGGAYDYFDSDCRSARRLYYTASSFFTDTDLGFRVVLVAE
ncbi:MAG TPA: SUMF1/EgtB/PvdO family nonheme iron enzyme [Dongiaceae bacterium]|nr:SUMF1/EgtB/PvdO family nonheme iron enzyme [Dongiaceae bacterium]